jgi:Tannase and feruloyl esterase/3HB-oligomer hydrolase (3HBOH)
VPLVPVLLAAWVTPAAAAPPPGPCANQAAIHVPGAQLQRVECEADLSATALSLKGRSDASDWAGLSSARTVNPPAGAGIQIDGYFPDDSTTNTENNWNHDSQFVIRLPEHWNGQLVITGAPGVRKQYAPDFIISDWVLSMGYAYASTDKGNTGTSFFDNGSRSAPGQAVREWHDRVTQLTRAAKQVVAQRYGTGPARTWMTGISNGGYLTRWQLENHPELFDGGVDWEGTLMTPDGPNLFTYLPTALREYPQAEVDPAARQAMYDVGFAPGSEVLWRDHYAEYWDLTQRTYREAFDPTYDGATKAGTPFCTTGTAPGTPTACDAQYDYASRPRSVHQAVASVSLTGRIGKPMITLHGDLDALLPIRTDSDVYDRMIQKAGRGSLHRYYTIQDGNHVDGRADLYPQQLRPILPCYREAFQRLTAWVTTGKQPPVTQTVARQTNGDEANTCPQLAATASGEGGHRR